MINFAVAILIYVIIFALLLLVTYRYGMSLFSSITVSALISMLVLLLLIPPGEIDKQVDMYMKENPHKQADDVIVLIYLILLISTVLLISWYVLDKAFKERDEKIKIHI